jgi:hypothetical protein
MTQPLFGADVLVKVATIAAPTVFVTVENMNNYSASSTHPVTTEPVFGKAVALRAEQIAEQSFSLSGFVTLADPGMQIIADAERLRTDLMVQVLADGTNGFKQQCSVSTIKTDGNPKAFQAVALDCVATGVRTAVGTGWQFL